MRDVAEVGAGTILNIEGGVKYCALIKILKPDTEAVRLNQILVHPRFGIRDHVISLYFWKCHAFFLVFLQQHQEAWMIQEFIRITDNNEIGDTPTFSIGAALNLQL